MKGQKPPLTAGWGEGTEGSNQRQKAVRHHVGSRRGQLILAGGSFIPTPNAPALGPHLMVSGFLY